ncbi:activator of (R)-2-hydroxyglutaryl-CoA dehydratase [Halorhodospira abdelmalekii]|uniref:activator of (R)-2-hydroxyglutaryl-CoA dehydratase n=1 Tax=Halorhodospira abdelmalekii TaxID=421629 RepID=UPI00190669AA|nr:activator of (R)-2-hydroxyglutaryl-CoA dehydratase [Halorhodospira abdelmalekii]
METELHSAAQRRQAQAQARGPAETRAHSRAASSGERRHYRRPPERPFARAERSRVTILFGGLTAAHDRLIEAGLHGLGYRAQRIPVPNKADFHTGREYCNPGQCNPVYYVAGSLINYLERLCIEQGVRREQLGADYLFVTPGSCGPCRFGMYEAEYRRALERAGFTDFRVIAFDKKAGGEGHRAGAVGDGLQFDIKLYLTLINAILIGDLLNGLFYRLRPYAVDAAALDAVHERCLQICAEHLAEKRHDPIRIGVLARALHRLTPLPQAEDVARILAQLRDPDYVAALRRCREAIAEQIEVDWSRAKPIVRVTGEFWAQTTEGDGNFRMFQFLEAEGAEVHVEPVATWIDYMRHTLHWRLNDLRIISEDEARLGERLRPWLWLRARTRYLLRDRLLGLCGWLLHREFQRLGRAIGGPLPELTDQETLERLGHPYYHARITGGEGHLEVAKNLYAYQHALAHMTLSLKPFGCMPSTQSDGAQAAVLADFPQINFLPIETAGEGEINAYSRAQMALSEAKSACRGEFKRALQESGCSLTQIRAYAAAHPELRSPFYEVPRRAGVIGRAAAFVYHVGERIHRDPAWSPDQAPSGHQANAPSARESKPVGDDQAEAQ